MGETSAPGYKAAIQLPIPLSTEDGTSIPAGPYNLELRLEKGKYSLLFTARNQVISRVPERVADAAGESYLNLPLLGTIFLSPGGGPMKTDEERQYSKTGRPQYQDEDRDWKTTLRVYRSSNPGDRRVLFIFQERQQNRSWSRTYFFLHEGRPERLQEHR